MTPRNFTDDETGDVLAIPALRLQVYIRGGLADGRLRTAARAIYEAFEEVYGGAAGEVQLQFDRHKGKIVALDGKTQTAADGFFTREAFKFGDGVRRWGRANADFPHPGVPHVSIEDFTRYVLVELDLPPEEEEALALLERVSDIFLPLPLLWGAAGYGFFVPPYMTHAYERIPDLARRYRAAFLLQRRMVNDGLMRDGSAHRWRKDEAPGIADIAWRTFMGAPFLERVPDAAAQLATIDGVSVAAGDSAIAVTIGARPTWGDVNAGEDVESYRAVAKVLRPVAYPIGAALAFAFGGARSAEMTDATEFYFNRFR